MSHLRIAKIASIPLRFDMATLALRVPAHVFFYGFEIGKIAKYVEGGIYIAQQAIAKKGGCTVVNNLLVFSDNLQTVDNKSTAPSLFRN
jgi:hypothetical protein